MSNAKTLRILDAKNPGPPHVGTGAKVYRLWVSGAQFGTSRLRENILRWARDYADAGCSVKVNRGNVQVAAT